MNDKQLIERLRHCAGCDDCAGCQDYEKENGIEELMRTAAERISDLLNELRDERYRHDRYVDFELAEAEELRQAKETVVQQRLRAQEAEDFICKLCAECEWKDHDGITVMTKKCCNWFPRCGRFKLRDNRWIPVSERMPDQEWMEYGEQTGRILEVIVMSEYAKTATTLFYDGHDGFYNHGEDEERIFYPVSHWMPLPEDPRKERK